MADCLICNECEFTTDLFLCKGCEAVEYCSEACQSKDLADHQKICGSVADRLDINCIILYENGNIEQKNMSVDDMRKVWGNDWSEGSLVTIGSVGYRIDGSDGLHCGPNLHIPYMYGNLTIRRDCRAFWEHPKAIPTGPRSRILHSLDDILKRLKPKRRLAGFY